MIRYQRRKYLLVNLDNGTELELDTTTTNNEPRNWDDSDFTIKRSTKNFSLTRELSKNLEFTGAAAKFLLDAYNSKDVEAKVQMYEYRFNPRTDAPYIFTIGYFDFTEIKRTKTTVQIPFTSGGLNTLLKTKEKNKYELNRTESVNGVDIGKLDLDDFAVINRPIYLDSLSKTKEENKDPDNLILNVFETERALGIPVSVVYDSDDRFVSILPNQFDDTPSVGLSAMCFYYLNDIDKKFDLSIDLTCDINITSINDTDKYSIDLVVYENANTLDVKQRISLKEYLNVDDETINESISVNYSQTDFELLKDESLGLQFYANKTNDLALFVSIVKNIQTRIQITEFSVRNDLPRQAKCVLNNNVGRRKMAIINDDPNTYKSEFFESSEFKNTAITNGEYIRNLEDVKLTTSLKDWLDNSFSVYGMSYNIEIINGKETLVHEPLNHFFRSEVVVKIPNQVSEVKREVAKEFIFSSIKSGYKKPSGDNLYEEVNGLNEVNTSNEYITPITRIEKEYDIESPYRADSEGKELTVRKSVVLFPTEDYRTDKTIFNLDLKETPTGVYEERIWSDDYEELPKNVFSPETLTGLRLTPFRNLERHFWFVNNAFTKFTDKYIRYSSSRGNSDLITKKVGENEVKENGDYQINTLENPIFVSEWIEFTYKVDYDIITQINGFTEVNGRKIPNTYFKIEFINEFNQKEYGYLFDLKPNKEGKWKLLKAL